MTKFFARTDRQTDDEPITIPLRHLMPRGKKLLGAHKVFRIGPGKHYGPGRHNLNPESLSFEIWILNPNPFWNLNPESLPFEIWILNPNPFQIWILVIWNLNPESRVCLKSESRIPEPLFWGPFRISYNFSETFKYNVPKSNIIHLLL